AFHVHRVCQGRIEHGGQQGPLTDDLHVKCPRGLARVATDRHAYRDHVRLAIEPTGDAGADVGVDDADHAERRAHLEAHGLPRINRVDVPRHEGKLTGADAEIRMTPTVDAVAFDGGDRA